MSSDSPAELMATAAGAAVCFCLFAWVLIVFRRELASEVSRYYERVLPRWLRVRIPRRFFEVVHLIGGIGCGVLGVFLWADFVSQVGLALRGELRPERPGAGPPGTAGTVILFGFIALVLAVGGYVLAGRRRGSG